MKRSRTAPSLLDDDAFVEEGLQKIDRFSLFIWRSRFREDTSLATREHRCSVSSTTTEAPEPPAQEPDAPPELPPEEEAADAPEAPVAAPAPRARADSAADRVDRAVREHLGHADAKRVAVLRN